MSRDSDPYDFIQDDGFEIIKKSLTTSHLESAFEPEPSPEPVAPPPPTSDD